MDDIRKWALCVTLCTFVGVIIYILSPKGALDKTMKTIISLFIIAALLSPFINGEGISLEQLSTIDSIDTQKKTEIESLINEQVKQCVINAAREEIKAILKENNIDGGQILIITDINDAGSIIIKEAQVKIPSRYNADTHSLSVEISKKMGFEIKVQVI
ncbi:MAG: hypothetical protein GX824_04235 [Clostridiales bacterium]|jgi:hypothetical protein|nr:hypothetical protein [Clostridiales bacterium]